VLRVLARNLIDLTMPLNRATAVPLGGRAALQGREKIKIKDLPCAAGQRAA
jgi:hypothetical protein